MSPRLHSALLALIALHFPSARAGIQSVFEATGKEAVQILEITWVLFIGGGLIFLAIMLLLLVSLFGPPSLRAALGRRAWVIGGGVLFPTVVLFALLVYTLMASAPLRRAQADAATRVEVSGELWWWRVKYLDAQGNSIMETANEIRIPVGQPVDLLLITDNVIHSFWVPKLGGKLDLIPGHVNRQRIEASEAGIFRGQCAEYCGAQHARMALYVVAQAPEEYRAWLAAQMRAAAEPKAPTLQQGKQLFMENRCGMCHTIRGTQAEGRFGPDLTHLGSRLSIAGGTLPQNQGTVAGWIAESQRLKPGNKMPAFAQFSADELRALSAYLTSLQ